MPPQDAFDAETRARQQAAEQAALEKVLKLQASRQAKSLQATTTTLLTYVRAIVELWLVAGVNRQSATPRSGRGVCRSSSDRRWIGVTTTVRSRHQHLQVTVVHTWRAKTSVFRLEPASPCERGISWKPFSNYG